MMNINERLSLLKDYLIEKYADKGVCLAFSGGADSSLLLKVLAMSGIPMAAVTFATALHPRCDTDAAKALAKKLGAKHEVIEIDEFEDEHVMENTPQRCYYCKSLLFSRLWSYAKANGFTVLMDGTNFDDLSEYRPGLKALGELSVVSPLAELEISKTEVREMAAALGLEVSGKPASPCLATRLPYYTKITQADIIAIGEAEAALKAHGFAACRVRKHGNIARIEIPVKDFEAFLRVKEIIAEELLQIGFDYVTLDIQGLRSGSMDLESVIVQADKE